MDSSDHLEDRKKKEIEWADFRRTLDDPELKKKYTVNSEFYTINRAVDDYVARWLKKTLRAWTFSRWLAARTDWSRRRATS